MTVRQLSLHWRTRAGDSQMRRPEQAATGQSPGEWGLWLWAGYLGALPLPGTARCWWQQGKLCQRWRCQRLGPVLAAWQQTGVEILPHAADIGALERSADGGLPRQLQLGGMPPVMQFLLWL